MKLYIINIILLTAAGLIVELLSRNKVTKILYCIYAWLQMTVIAAVRFGTGIDYNQYYNTFYEISRAQDWSELLHRREEIGYLFCNRMMSYITDNIIVFMLFYYGIMFGLLLWYIYVYTEVKWIAVVSFIALDFYAMTYCFMRQGMAIVIGLYVLEMIKKRKWIRACILTAIASLFHISALLLLLCLLVSYIPWQKKKLQIAFVMFGAMCYIGCDSFLKLMLVGPFSKYADYVGTQFMEGNQGLLIFYPVLCFGIAYGMKSIIGKNDEQFSNMMPVLFLGILLYILSTKHYIVERMALYITVYNIKVASNVMGAFNRKEQTWKYILVVVCSLVIIASAFAFSLANDRYGIIPYGTSEYYLHKCEWLKVI